MEGYTSDKEQIEMIKTWWKNYGKFLLIAVGVGLLIGFGWRYYHRYETQHSEQASMIYEKMMGQVAAGQIDQAGLLAKDLKTNFANTPYAGLAAMAEAKRAVDAKKLTDAITALQWVIKNSNLKPIKQIARLRAARVQIAMKQPKAALTLLSVIEDKTYQPMIEEVRGQAYWAMGDMTKARAALEAAKTGYQAIGITNPILEMQLSQK